MVRLRRARDIVSSNRMTTGFHPAVGMATMSGMRHDDMVGVSARAIRIGVLDNDPFALDAMCAMISAVSKDFRVMWSTGSPAVAIEHCHNPHTRPEVLVLDMALGGITGADVCRRIRRRTGGTGIVCVTSYSVDVYQREAIASGAQGLFAKERLRTDIAVAIRWAAQSLPADEHEYQQQLDELRDAASRAMGHTHEVIDSLENHPQRPSDPSHEGSHGSKQPRTADSTEVDAAAQRAGLQSLIDEEEARLEAPGFTGDNLLAEPHRPLTPETMRLLAGLLSNLLAELYANIAKHAIRANGTPSASPSTRTPSTSPPATPSHPMTRDSASTATKPSSKHTSAPSKPTPNKPTGSWRLAFQSMAAGKTCIRRPAMSSNRMTRIIRLRHRRRMTTPAGHPRGRRR